MTREKTAELLRRIAAEIILHPDLLRVQALDQGEEIEVNAKAHRGDTGRLIGPKGAIWRALQFLFATIGRQHRKKIVLNPLLEPTDGRPDQYPRYAPRENWDRERICETLTAIIEAIWEGAYVWSEDDMAETTLQLCCVPSSELTDEVIRALTPIVNQIGKRQGRTFKIELVEAQPATAAGRNAPEVEP